jgi:diketogulonate reductase-like aldo/keto reductase
LLPKLNFTCHCKSLDETATQYRELGRTGRRVSTISFGAWAIGGTWGAVADGESMAALHRGLDLGVNFFDTADVYGDGRSEHLLALGLIMIRLCKRLRRCVRSCPPLGPWRKWCRVGFSCFPRSLAPSPAQVEENMAAAELPPLSEATLVKVRALYETFARPWVHHRWRSEAGLW